tara:strand:+ start:2171 stop:2455 length:285 start_codon:yes stop_codon:yes gene_type:complete
MSTLTNVFSEHADATGVIYAGATNLAGYQIAPGGTAGEIIFRDGGASGTVRLRVNIPVTPLTPISTLIPGNGIRFNTNIHVTLPTNGIVTIFYG